jgi:hypothetical protein
MDFISKLLNITSMRNVLYSLALCTAIQGESLAQTTSLPFIESFNPTMPQMGWQMFRKGVMDPFYKFDIGSIQSFDGSYLFHNYPVGGTAATDDWYVSLPFSFASGGKIDSVRYSFSGFGLPQAGDTVAIYLLQGSPDPAVATKTLLNDFRGAAYVADNTWKKTMNIIIPQTAGTSYIAFRYRTVNNWLDVRFDNLGLSGNGVNGIDDKFKAGLDFTIAPNPFANKLTVHTNRSFERVRIYDALGKAVYDQSFQTVIDLSSLPSGSYFLELADADQENGFITIYKH